MEENNNQKKLSDDDTESYAQELSKEFLRDSRRYCRVLTTEVEE